MADRTHEGRTLSATEDRDVPRVVIDTNVLVGAAYNPGSASARVVAACLDGRLVAVVSPALLGEYAWILPRAVRGAGRLEPVERFLAVAVEVVPAETVPVVAGDPADDALFAAAVAGGARAIVTNDRPVLEVGSFRGVAVIRPSECAAALLG
jgi:putative PIN family toxin of toxin-antitoxin system